MCADSPIGRSGTSFTTELRLAEVILAGRDAARIPEAARLLDVAEPQVIQLRSFRNVVFRHTLGSARVAWLRRDPAARQLARDVSINADASCLSVVTVRIGWWWPL
jgi:hypothetical protein